MSDIVRLGLATSTQISVYKSPFPSAGTAVSLFRAKMVQQRPLLLSEVGTQLQTDRAVHVYALFVVCRIFYAALPIGGCFSLCTLSVHLFVP